MKKIPEYDLSKFPYTIVYVAESCGCVPYSTAVAMSASCSGVRKCAYHQRIEDLRNRRKKRKA